MNIFKKLFKKDVDSIQTKVNEDSEGIGGEEYVISSTKDTTKEE